MLKSLPLINNISSLLRNEHHWKKEKMTWKDHILKYDRQAGISGLNFLGEWKEGELVHLCTTKRTWNDVTYFHWFVTNKKYIFEFEYDINDICRTKVNIKEYSGEPLTSKESKPMNEEMRNRMRSIMGMSNYSMCLRNSEHVANYVMRGEWWSSQMETDGHLRNFFSKKLNKSCDKLINQLPATLKTTANLSTQKMYSFITDNYCFKNVDYWLMEEENTFNILILGPAGAGKSHLINIIFNQRICQSSPAHKSVTKDIVFLRGTGDVYDESTREISQRPVIVADTIGLCDTEWSCEEVIDLIRQKTTSNIRYIDLVFVIFKADRLTKENVNSIKEMLKWLNYSDNYKKFVFISTFVVNSCEETIKRLREEAIEILGLHKPTEWKFANGEMFESLIYVNFVIEEHLNENVKNKVWTSWSQVRNALVYAGSGERIRINDEDSQSKCVIS